MGPFQFLSHAFRLMRPYRARQIAGFIAVAIQVAFFFSLPLFYREIFDRAIPTNNLSYLGHLTLLMLAFFGCHLIAESVEARITAQMAADILRDIRRELFKYVQKLPIGFFANTSLGDLLSRFTNDLTMVEHAMVSSLYQVCFHTMSLAAATALLFVFEWRLAALTVLSYPLGYIGPKLLARKAGASVALRKEEDAQTMSVIQENLLAQRVIRGFALQISAIEKFSVRLGALHTRSRDLHHRAILIGKTSGAGVLATQLIVLLGGAYFAITGHLSGGSLVGFLALLSSMGNSTRVLTGTLPELGQAAAGFRRVLNLMRQPIEGSNQNRSLALPPFHSEIRFDHVSFRYKGEQLSLDDISFTVQAGQSVAFVGRSGSGKSTVLNLITRFYETETGSIFIDGHKLRQISEESLRSQISTVFQDTILFNTTVRENIRQGRLNATDQEVESAAKSAEIHDFIATLPHGYDSQVGEMGGHLSGGQRQRISLARAILHNPTLLLLDEATSALDPATEAAINKTLEKISENCTIISVTHRLTSAVNSDQIFVMDQGKLVERGTHRELLNKKGIYFGLWQEFTLVLAQDALVGEIESKSIDISSTDIDVSPEALAQKVRELEGKLHAGQKESDRLRAINHRWAQLAGTDQLTGLPNKLSFLEAVVPQEMKQAHHDQHDIGFMLVSGDNLGPINERFGRDAGDVIIHNLARILQSVLKGEEQLGHLDGANFAVSLHPASLGRTRSRAEEIRGFVAGQSFAFGQTMLKITASIGITVVACSQLGDTRQATEEAFALLNGALYKAKRMGGNAVASS
jgi:ATP-binding cassette, subfamily B, bacterial